MPRFQGRPGPSKTNELDVQRKKTAYTVEHGSLDALEYGILRGLADYIDLLGRQVVEAPIRLVDGDSKWSAIAPVMIFSELGKWNALLMSPDCVPQGGDPHDDRRTCPSAARKFYTKDTKIGM